MSIGKTIRDLRRERGITQEQLAEYIGVSASAVSQWECEKSCPDITQLPVLANIFQVTTDEILSVNIRNNAARITAINHEALAAFHSGRRDEAETLLRDGLRCFPTAHKLMGQLAELLYVNAYGCDREGQDLLEEALCLAERVIDECGDMDIKADAISTAVNIYRDMGRLRDAERCACLLPEMTRSDLLAGILTGERLVSLYRGTLIQQQITSGLFYALRLAELEDDRGGSLYTEEERLLLYQKILTVYATLYEKEDYHYFAQFLVAAHERMARIYAQKGAIHEALKHLKVAAESALRFESYDGDEEKTSLLFRGVKDGGWVRECSGAVSSTMAGLLENLRDEVYEPVRSQPAFAAVSAMLAPFGR